MLRLLRIPSLYRGDQPVASVRNSGRARLLAAVWPAILLASLILLPYLGKAHTIDDVTFLLQAKHVFKDPFHPTAFEMLSDGNRVRLSSLMVSGPVMAYLLVPSVLLGGAEWTAHLVQFLLVILAILATVSLAMQLGIDRRALDWRPDYCLDSRCYANGRHQHARYSGNGICSFWHGALLAWRQERRWHQCITAAASFALAILSRPHLILLLAVATISLLDQGGAKIHVPAGPFSTGVRFLLRKFAEAIPLFWQHAWPSWRH